MKEYVVTDVNDVNHYVHADKYKVDDYGKVIFTKGDNCELYIVATFNFNNIISIKEAVE